MATTSVLPLLAQRLTGKVALITGAASGIGAATAKLFARHGAKVVVTDIQDDLGRSVAQDIDSSTASASASFIHCDVSDEGNIRAAVDYAVSRYGKLDILFSNAGISGGRSAFGSILDADADVVRKTFEVNAIGPLHCAKHAARIMVGAKTRGCIIFTSSAASKGVTPNIPHAYTASKSAVEGLTRGLAVELGRHGIRVNCVSPYAVGTVMSVDAFGLVRQEAEETFENAGNLKGVVLREDDVAEAVVYLASEEAKYVMWDYIPSTYLPRDYQGGRSLPRVGPYTLTPVGLFGLISSTSRGGFCYQRRDPRDNVLPTLGDQSENDTCRRIRGQR